MRTVSHWVSFLVFGVAAIPLATAALRTQQNAPQVQNAQSLAGLATSAVASCPATTVHPANATVPFDSVHLDCTAWNRAAGAAPDVKHTARCHFTQGEHVAYSRSSSPTGSQSGTAAHGGSHDYAEQRYLIALPALTVPRNASAATKLAALAAPRFLECESPTERRLFS